MLDLYAVQYLIGAQFEYFLPLFVFPFQAFAVTQLTFSIREFFPPSPTEFVFLGSLPAA